MSFEECANLTERDLKCPHCGKDIGEGKRFCVYCGGSLADVGKKKYCQYCGNELESEEHFCKNCGHRVESRAVNVSLENFGGSVKNFVSSGVSNIKSTVGKSFVDSSFESRFTLGHYILAALAALTAAIPIFSRTLALRAGEGVSSMSF